MYLYNLTLQRATGITHSVHGQFSGAKLQEIVVSRGKILEMLRPELDTQKVNFGEADWLVFRVSLLTSSC